MQSLCVDILQNLEAGVAVVRHQDVAAQRGHLGQQLVLRQVAGPGAGPRRGEVLGHELVHRHQLLGPVVVRVPGQMIDIVCVERERC